MNAGREAHYGYDENKETDDGTAAREPDPSGTEQRIRAAPFTAGEARDAGRYRPPRELFVSASSPAGINALRIRCN